MQVSLFSPAKLNLSLAITGRRADGFHDLVSVVAPLTWGDTLHAEGTETRGETLLTCDDPALATDETNLVRKAAGLFRATTGWQGGVRFRLEKRIPTGAGLGGGSSNAVAALRALQRVSGCVVAPETMLRMAAAAGSDCPLFLADGPVIMRGRGERVEALPESGARRLVGRRVLVCKPAFGIATAWAYGRLADGVARGVAAYAAGEKVEDGLQRWLQSENAPAEALLNNTFEQVAFAKFVALPTLAAWVEARCGVTLHLSGSGSACFALLGPEVDATHVAVCVREAWGASALVVESALAGNGAPVRF
ncbi:4-(cytidine 5'-diphospho)-2-C-methyl-D-erythritol kinase [Horticoccus luteus]|uniref:4-diphosphocytidyl-2-C-methyl-D-erythritol kinase n=1 Tax=Horticoccus luteus TaxID=2862869 RepID=A0A8F9XH16_9BACT|nr:4-(cytidine 5'-diphospho)-2-C-methyl-D-erythritol kinase [Horticoccus luteus]QYM79837.1 4-(cytidine 5'-diphospho)-2-C-methyl-D-erythritol kinase [Horticoccus luteus]